MNYSKPMVSIITPAYNAEQTIAETIQSVQKQTFLLWEMIIVDDVSTDDTKNIVKKYAAMDERITLVSLNENSGAAVARNNALDRARGRYIAFLDSDDLWTREKLEKQLSFMKQHHYAFSFTGYEYMSADGIKLNKHVEAPIKITYEDMLKNTIVGCLTVIIDSEQTGKITMPNLRTRQDLVTWLQLLKKGWVAYGLNESLAYYRRGNSSISKNKWKAAKINWFVYRKVEKLNVWKTMWCFCHYARNAVMKRM